MIFTLDLCKAGNIERTMGNERWITSRETGARQGRGADWLVGRLYVRRYKYRGSAVTTGATGLSRNAPAWARSGYFADHYGTWR